MKKAHKAERFGKANKILRRDLANQIARNDQLEDANRQLVRKALELNDRLKTAQAKPTSVEITGPITIGAQPE